MIFKYNVQVFDLYTDELRHQFSVTAGSHEFRRLIKNSNLPEHKIRVKCYDNVDGSTILEAWIIESVSDGKVQLHEC